MKKRTIKILITAILASVMLSGCLKDAMNDQRDNVVNFTTTVASASDYLQTKASANEMMGAETTLISEDGAISLPLSFRSTPGISVIDDISNIPATKGDLINDNDNGDLSNIDLPSTIGSFKVAAWTGTTASIPAYTNVTYADGKWSTATSYLWKKGETKTFVAYANLPASGSSIVSTSAGTQALTHTVPTNVSDQKDILMGYYTGDGNGTGTAAITFYHPLTAVKVVAGEIEGIKSIKNISLSGVYASGTTTQSAAGTTFTWSNTTATTTVSQTFSTPISIPVSGDDKQLGDAFLLIPQELTTAKTVTLTVTAVTSADKDIVLAAEIPAGNWLAGYTNAYTIVTGAGISTNQLDLYNGHLL